jgi:hypothetical protein
LTDTATGPTVPEAAPASRHLVALLAERVAGAQRAVAHADDVVEAFVVARYEELASEVAEDAVAAKAMG